MKETIWWIIRKSALPFLPVIFGVIIRHTKNGYFSFEYFDGAEIAFSISVVMIVVIGSLDKHRDELIKKQLIGFFQTAIFIFIALFSLQLSTKVQIELSNFNILSHISDSLNLESSKIVETIEFLEDQQEIVHILKNELIISRGYTILIGLVVLVSTMYIYSYYELED